MAPWELHEIFLSLDIKNVPGYPIDFSSDWWDDCLKFDGYFSSFVTHVVKLLKYALDINVRNAYTLIRLFLTIYLEEIQNKWVNNC